MIAFFDLEGPLCPIDHAAEVLAVIGKKLGREKDFYLLFEMLSLFDDELFLVDKKEDYWPGDTLKLIAPIIVTYANEELLLRIAERAELTPGAKELFQYLHEKDIPTFIISTSYTQHAHTIAKKLNHPLENVRCTSLNFQQKPSKTTILEELIDDLFPKYLDEGLPAVKKALNRFFFEKIPKSDFGPLFRETVVCGGGRKRENVIQILKEYGQNPAEAIAVGDSITDIQMLEYIRENGGTAISFNGNEHSLKPATIAYSGRSINGLIKVFQAFPKVEDFLKKLSKEEMTKHEEFFDSLINISSKEFQRILQLQKKYRSLLRQRAARLT